MMPRDRIVNILEKIVYVLEVSDRPLSTAEIAKYVGVDHKTAIKYLKLLWRIGVRGRIKLVANTGNLKLWSFELRGVTEIPEYERRNIVREYFPKPRIEDAIIVALRNRRSMTINELAEAIKGMLKNEKVERDDVRRAIGKIRKYGIILKEDDRLRLTEYGEKLARGTSWLYPELET